MPRALPMFAIPVLAVPALLASLLCTSCAGTKPIYSPPPGGHGALSVPPPAILPIR